MYLIIESRSVLSIDRYEIGNGNTGKITKALHKAYLEVVSGKNNTHMNWLTPIYE